jgi:hypothetical protein
MKKAFYSSEKEKEIPTKERETTPKPQQPNKEKENDPWNVPAPLVNPTPKA